ncbi:MAG: ATP-binding cassette domain-containing protein [Bacilli bacterium]|nr:ATP-binding cassette domain-containing protein [Bacilli bacterium]
MGIKFKNVCYGNIDKLNLDLHSNEVVSVIGADEKMVNDFLDLIYGFKIPTEGEIVVNRKTINNKVNDNKLAKIRECIAYLIPDSNSMLFNINVLEDIKYGLNKVNDKKLYDLLELFNLEEKILSKNYTELSDSEKKKICLISILLKDTKITILSNLCDYFDSKTKSNLVKYLRKEKRSDKLFIITSQDTDFILQVSDRVLTMSDREIKLEQDKYNFFSNQDLMYRFQMSMPFVVKFRNSVLNKKKIKLNNRDNVNDLLKDIYRNASKINE